MSDRTRQRKNVEEACIGCIVVLVILTVLAAVLIQAIGRSREKAKVAATEHDLQNLKTALADYFITRTPNTYPPRAGCLFKGLDIDDRDRDPDHFYDQFYRPYLARMDLVSASDFVDTCSFSEDLNLNGDLESATDSETDTLIVIEDQPVLDRDAITQTELYREPNRELDGEQVPYQYFPVYSRNLKKFRELLRREDDLYAARAHTTQELRDAGLRIPPPFYDSFAVFSVGPMQKDFDIIPRNVTSADDLRIRAYYRLTRDLNNNGIYDFDYRARSEGQETQSAFENPGDSNLPDGSMGFGVIIYSDGVKYQ